MSKLQPFITGDSIGYVWTREGGSRVIILVDDWYDLPDWNYKPPTAHAYGLVQILNQTCQWNDTRAIGFFSLPEPGSDRDARQVIEQIKSWTSQFLSEHCKYYLLVDYYFGEAFQEENAVGLQFVDLWMRLQPLSSETVKLAHLSIGGGSKDFPNPYRLKRFKKTMLEDSGQLPSELLKWLDFEQHPLECLWSDRHDWFLSDNAPAMKHDAASVANLLFCDTEDSEALKNASLYKQNVQQALGVTFPESWWQNQESLRNIHNSMKCLCGAFFCGQTEQPGRRHISVGAAYLIALIAYQNTFNNIDAIAQDEEMWIYSPQVTSPLFPSQDRETARNSAKALYDLFANLFSPRQGESSTVKTAFFENNGKMLKIQLSWSADKVADNRQESLSQGLSHTLNQGKILVPDSASNTRDAVLRLYRCMAISETGFMGPGTIYMDGDMLVLASTK